MKDILKLAQIQVLFIVIFIFFKIIRPSILNSASPEFFKEFLLSAPNLFESIIGVLILTGVVLLLNERLKEERQIKLNVMYLLVVIIAGTYVITQELNVINLRSKSTFDQNDLIYSVIGLIIGYGIVLCIKPRIHN